MLRFLAVSLPTTLMMGCITVKPIPEAPSEPSGIEVITSNPVATPQPFSEEAFASDYCELLLDSLEQAQPLLSNMESQLSAHARHMDAAVARLAQPGESRASDCPQPQQTAAEGKDLIGSLEWIYMTPPGRHYRARVDSGAETSSLSAKNIVEFERDGKDWVRFTFQHDGIEKDDDAEPVEIELPIVRTVLIRQASVKKAERRVSVNMTIRLGEQLQTTEFTLADRSRMTYPVLLGRAFLMDLYMVDVSQSYLHGKSPAP